MKDYKNLEALETLGNLFLSGDDYGSCVSSEDEYAIVKQDLINYNKIVSVDLDEVQDSINSLIHLGMVGDAKVFQNLVDTLKKSEETYIGGLIWKKL